MTVKQGYRIITAEEFDNKRLQSSESILARITFFNKLYQEDYEGILHLDIDKTLNDEEIEDVLKKVRKISFVGAVSYKQEILKLKSL